MKQKHAEFGSSCLRKTTKRASQYKLIVACILLTMSLSTLLKAHSLVVTIGTDSLHFSTTFEVIDYTSTCGDYYDVAHTQSWRPDSLCDPKPTATVTYTRNLNSAHFQILSADSSCMLFDGFLEPPSTILGYQPLEMSIPINETLTNSSFSFDATSYFTTFTIRGTFSVPGFQIERGKSYVYHITEQTFGGCSGDPDGEKTESNEPLVEIACQTDDCCVVAGDANHDGVFSILDLTFLVDKFYGGGPDPVCLGEGDANGDCSFDNGIDGDLNYMVASIFTGGPAPVCPSP